MKSRSISVGLFAVAVIIAFFLAWSESKITDEERDEAVIILEANVLDSIYFDKIDETGIYFKGSKRYLPPGDLFCSIFSRDDSSNYYYEWSIEVGKNERKKLTHLSFKDGEYSQSDQWGKNYDRRIKKDSIKGIKTIVHGDYYAIRFHYRLPSSHKTSDFVRERNNLYGPIGLSQNIHKNSVHGVISDGVGMNNRMLLDTCNRWLYAEILDRGIFSSKDAVSVRFKHKAAVKYNAKDPFLREVFKLD